MKKMSNLTTNLATNPAFMDLVWTGWQYVQDVHWLLTEEGAQEQTKSQIDLLAKEAALVAASPKKGALPIPENVRPTLKKINNIVNFLIPTCGYLNDFFYYSTAIFYSCHFFSRFFTTVSLTFLAGAAFFHLIRSDCKKISCCATNLQRKFDLTIGDNEKASLKRVQLHARMALTKSHIEDCVREVTSLSNSLYLLQYILSPAIDQTKSHLEGLNQKIIDIK